MKKLNLNAIRIDGETQSRVSLDEGTVADYVECLDALPPVIVFNDGADNWLADGFHRFHAYRKAGKASIPAEIRAGTRRDAILFSLGANGTHGLRRSNADKRKAVSAMLADSEWSQWSDRKIADACGVSQPFVSSLRKPPEVITVITPAPEKVATVATPAAAKAPAKAAREVPQPAPEPEDNQLAEALHTVTELAQENERLQDRLAVEAMDASEEEKTQAAETIRELRERVRLLEIEVDSLKASRDTYMRESSEKTSQINYWRKKAEKAERAAA